MAPTCRCRSHKGNKQYQVKVYHLVNLELRHLWQLLSAYFSDFESCYDRRFFRFFEQPGKAITTHMASSPTGSSTGTAVCVPPVDG